VRAERLGDAALHNRAISRYVIFVWVCTTCLRALSPYAGVFGPCPTCGAHGRAKATSGGTLIEFSAHDGLPCAHCGRDNVDLRFRQFRYVIGMVFLDRVAAYAGYVCSSCKWRLFWKYQALTFVLGWWGFLAMLFRNPRAIISNVRALFSAPFFAEDLGALTLRQLETDNQPVP
jgi:predicted RNA-binding Zn-ribbon protein involved in translation (DUF1610 family)